MKHLQKRFSPVLLSLSGWAKAGKTKAGKGVGAHGLFVCALCIGIFCMILACVEPVKAGEGAGTDSPAKDRPNIVVIFTDDLSFRDIQALARYSDSALAGGKAPVSKAATPNMDRLVGESLLFTRFYMAATVCTPSRYALLTGQYGSRSTSLAKKYPVGGPANVEFNTDILPGQWDLAWGMKEAGYETGIVGKWHNTVRRDAARRPGMFANLWAQWLKATPANEGADSANDDSWPGKDEGLTEAESRRVRATYEEQVKYMKEKQGWDFVSSLYMENAGELGLPAQLSPQRQAEHNMEWFTAGALKFLDRQKGSGRPFFLYFAPNIPHSANPQFLKADPRATAEGFVDWHLGVQPSRKDVAQRLAAVGGAPNAAWAIWLDDGIGVVLKKLDELGMADNTLVIFSSDQQTGGKWTCYQGGSRVPFSVRWPGHVKPGENDTVLSSVDVVPTLLELGGGKLPPAARAVVDGQSFVPLLQGKSFTPRPALVEMGFGRTIISGDWEYIAARYPAEIESENKLDGLSPDLMGAFRSKDEKPGCWPSYASYQWKRKLWPSFGQRDQLFNLREDPLEQKNLADNPEYAGRLAEMRAQLANALQPLPHPFGEFKPAGDQ